MRFNDLKTCLKTAVLLTAVLLLGAGLADAQQQVNLTAGPTTVTLPDGTVVPMWGYTCDATQPTGTLATCANLNPLAPAATSTTPAGWSPVIITVPTGQILVISLTNNLSFTPTTPTGAATNYIPTSLTIVGQLGAGLGKTATSAPSPDHSMAQQVTWPIAAPGIAAGTPPTQGSRVQSFSTEVGVGATVAAGQCASPCALTFGTTANPLRPGTYLLESGTHPSIQGPMGLYGMVVVTCVPGTAACGTVPAGTAYPAVGASPAVNYNAEANLLFSEIDPAQNNAVQAAVTTTGFSEAATRGAIAPGPVVSVSVDNGGTGYTSVPTVSFSGGGGTGALATAVIDTDPSSSTYHQVIAINMTNGGSGYTSNPNVSLSGGGGTGAQATSALQPATNTIANCSGGAQACYPPAVNYTPLYYLINGVAFDKTHASASLFGATAGATGTPPVPVTTGITGTVLARVVNAGLRMHVPSIVGSQTGTSGASGFSLIAEDGNPLPGLPRVQSEVFMAAGKTYDVMINVPTGGVSAIAVLTAGAGYNNGASGTLAVSISGGGGTGATATATVDATGAITAITVTNAGSGYTSQPTVTIVDPSGTGSNFAAGPVALNAGTVPVYDRELSLSASATSRDGGMLAYIGVNGSGLPGRSTASGGIFGPAQANPDTYNSLVAGQKFTVSDPAKGVIANDVNVYGVQLDAANPASGGTVTLNANGTFAFVPTGTSGSFGYCANGTTATSTTPVCTTVTLGASSLAGNPTAIAQSYTSKMAMYIQIASPGLLVGNTDPSQLPLTIASSSLAACTAPITAACGTVDLNGGFTLALPTPSTPPTTTQTATFTYTVQNSQGRQSTAAGNVIVNFPAASNLQVKVLDGADKTTVITDYRWIIEEDRTFYVDPNCTTNSTTAIPGCPPPPAATITTGTTVPPTFGVNFHTSYMPVVAVGCTGQLSCEGGQTVYDNNPASATFGQHLPAVCDVGNGVCRTTASQQTAVDPSLVHLDPTKRYFISILPGDAANPFAAAYAGAPDCSAAGVAAGSCGHGMGGAPIPPACNILTTGCTAVFAPVTILTQPSPYPPALLSVFVFEDDFPLNGEHDAGGGTGAVNTTNEAGLGGFEITLFDDAGGTGDATGQLTHDMFNQPLSNSLAGTIDPLSGYDACPITAQALVGMDSSNGNAPGSQGTIGITGRIVTCPEFEADGVTPSPLAGQATIPNMMQGRYGVVATPAADRIARGEEWLQTNTLDGQKAHDSFLRIGEPSYFQEYGPAGWHVSIGFANPTIINSRKAGVCNGSDPNFPPSGGINCNNTLTGRVTTERMSRTPDQRLYGSGSNDSFSFTQCYVSFGDPDGEDFAFTKCAADGTFTLSGLPDGVWRLTVFDQWNDMLVDGLSTPVGLSAGTSPSTTNLGDIATSQWQANIYTSTFFDANGNGVFDANETGLTLVATNIRFRDGSFSNFNNTDLAGSAGFNEVFPLFSWYVVETDSTRYKSTGTHVVYDAGGPADGTLNTCGGTLPGAGFPPCGPLMLNGSQSPYAFMANTVEQTPVPSAVGDNLRVPGAYYCSNADCSDAPAPLVPGGGGSGGSTGRVDPPWVASEGWQGFSGQNSFLEFGKKPFCAGSTCGPTTPANVSENGGIHGEVVYDSTRPFDDPQLNLHLSWTPNVPNVTVNLYQEGFAADGVTPTRKLVDTTKTSSWDDWAQGFRSDGVPNMNCPGQTTTDLFYFSLLNQPNYLDVYNSQHSNPPTAPHTILNSSQFKCYDGMHNWNQLQPAPYDGAYRFPSVNGIDPATGKWAMINGTYATNCTICIPNPDTTDPWRSGTPMLPAGKYVVEVVLPPGYELVKEEDKNILIGDNYIAPVTQEFGGLGAIYILPDQASVASGYNANNAQNPTTNLGTLNLPRGEGDTGSVEQFWPCVGEARVVPDFMSIFPQAQEVAAFAGATRNLCDRREITLQDQASALAKFYIFSSTHVAAHFTGVITDDFTSEFDPFSPVFGEKFSPPNQPVSVKDWAGNEISRVYSDHWGDYDGLTYSTWEVNPPNPTGYGPMTMVTCMNDPGPILDTNPASPTYNKMITDPLFNPQYSQFCYEIPFMPGQTQYMDTPVVPTSAFAGAGYNNVDCSYPDATPAVAEVDSNEGIGPWVSAAGTGHTLTITALGDQMVPNNAYAGPQATSAPYNQKYVKRHFGFGSQAGVNGTTGSVTIGGVPAAVSSWTDNQIVVTVPNGVPPCPVQQQAQYGGPGLTGTPALCGELVINTSSARSGGNVTGVTITRGGSYSSTPTVIFGAAPAGGTTATGTPVLGNPGVASVTVGSVGSGYTSAPTVSFTGGGGTGAAGTALVRRPVASVGITNGGSYTTGTPTVTFTNNTGAACGGAGTIRATGTAVMAAAPAPRHVASVTITNPGRYPFGCTVAVTFTGGGATTAAAGTVTMNASGSVTAVTVTAPGSGYTSAPTVGFSGGGGSGAAATAVLSTGRPVVSVTINNPGVGYTAAPSVTFSAGVTGGTSTALGTATLNPSIVTAGRQSVDTVTVTIGGKPPAHVKASETIQSYIDAAAPGDLIIVDPTCSTTGTSTQVACSIAAGITNSSAAHNELLIMWKPVRLQGVGAASSIINANTHPAGTTKLSNWRQRIVCLFGLGVNGAPISSGPTPANAKANPFDPTGGSTCNTNQWNYFTAYDESATGAGAFNPQVDRLPLEATVGWTAELNGNLAEQLQEPSLMGALEGAGITVLSKGVSFPSDPFDPALLAGFPTGTSLLIGTDVTGGGNFPVGDANSDVCVPNGTNPFPSNYSCNPSSIDGLGITDSSQGGGGIFVHGWAHNLQIANNRIYNNAGTLSGGINVGQGEFPGSYIQGAGALNAPPGSCEDSPVPNAQLPYCQNINVNIHNNYIALNSSTGDELFSATPAGAGGVSICTGADYYKFNYNWVCGNLSSGDGGGFAHLGYSSNGDIEHNSILFNQSTNPTIPTNGGGLIIMGTPDADLVCNGNAAIDQDCPPANAPGGNPANTPAASVSPSDGVGPGLVINANLIMGNGAESGTGAGIAFNSVNGNDIVSFPTDPGQWNLVTVTNNIIVDNVGGWDGAGISLHDSPNVNIINNTIAYNSSTASAGILFNTLGAPLASQYGTSCTQAPIPPATSSTRTCPQPAGLVAIQHSAVLAANLLSINVVCPPGHFQTTAANGSCKNVSYPKLENNIFWHNSSYYIGVGALSTAFQQNVVSLYNAFTSSQVASQPAVDASTTAGGSTTITGGTGACLAGANAPHFWDLGVRGDTGPADHSSGVILAATRSVLTLGGSAVLPTATNSAGNPLLISQYCNGSRVSPETPGLLAAGWQVPPGISDATVPNPIFNLTPTATVDEGNNWVNMRWGPLSMTNPTVVAGPNGNYGGGLPLGNYGVASAASSAQTRGITPGTTNYFDAPTFDFYDTLRKPGAGGTQGPPITAGAVQVTGAPSNNDFTTSASVLDFGFVPVYSPTTLDQDLQVTNTGVAALTFGAANSNFTIDCTGLTAATCNIASFRIQSNTCAGATIAPGESCVVNIVFLPTSTSHAARNATLHVVVPGVGSALVSLTGHDTFAVITVAPTTLTLATTPASLVAVTGTITLTNIENICLAPTTSTTCPAGTPPNSSPDAGPFTPTAITLTPAAGTAGGAGAWTLGGTCAVGTPLNPGTVTPGSPATPGGSCTITVTYTPPAGATATTPNLAGTAVLTVYGLGIDGRNPAIATANVAFPMTIRAN